MQIIFWTMLAHFVYDFHIQGDSIAQNKSKYNFILFIHALTWAMIISVPLKFLGVFSIWKLIFLFVTHFIIDGWKCRLPKTPEYFWSIYVDQGLHVITILMVSLF